MIDRYLSKCVPGGTYSVSLNVDLWKEPSRRRPPPARIDVVSLCEETAAWIEGLVRAVSSEQCMLATPCPKWNVHDLLTRIVSLPSLSPATLRDAVHPAVDQRAFVGVDPAAAYRARTAELLTAINPPG